MRQTECERETNAQTNANEEFDSVGCQVSFTFFFKAMSLDWPWPWSKCVFCLFHVYIYYLEKKYSHHLAFSSMYIIYIIYISNKHLLAYTCIFNVELSWHYHMCFHFVFICNLYFFFSQVYIYFCIYYVTRQWQLIHNLSRHFIITYIYLYNLVARPGFSFVKS